MRVGFWLDDNGHVQDELDTNIRLLELFVFDRSIIPVVIKHWTQVKDFDGDLLTFDYGGITGGYGPNPVVPVLVDGVREWCANNPDRLALIWCTFRPEFYLQDFKHMGGIPGNLRCWYRMDQAVIDALRSHYKDVP